MEIYNQERYASELQLIQILNLMPIQIRTLRVEIYITTTEEFFTRNRLTPQFEKEVRAVLDAGAEGGFFGNSNKQYKWNKKNIVVIFEDLIINRYGLDQLYWTLVFLLVHELRHCEQLNFFRERWSTLQSDYHLNYMETADTFDELPWCEKDAYTYAYRFLENKKNEITAIFQLEMAHDIPPIDFDIDMELLWKTCKKKLDMDARILWYLADLFWPVKQMSKERRPDILELQRKSDGM
ncbi:hypothetical protein FT637_29655 [Bacillus cereus]|uniref:hypothetical protein n=1 Tax=Bacillus cereus TaxID=1396 RepID=UPI001879E67C|nr:hypothetical protein [Bacillus cereus]MBE7106985.1 hypothetical protein [Bacillus cereus]